jgi:hypothetical protein
MLLALVTGISSMRDTEAFKVLQPVYIEAERLSLTL